MQPSLQLSLQLSFGSAIELTSWPMMSGKFLRGMDGQLPPQGWIPARRAAAGRRRADSRRSQFTKFCQGQEIVEKAIPLHLPLPVTQSAQSAHPLLSAHLSIRPPVAQTWRGGPPSHWPSSLAPSPSPSLPRWSLSIFRSCLIFSRHRSSAS